MTGTFPPKPPIDQIVMLDEIRKDGYIIRNVRVEFGPQRKDSVRIRLVIPDSGKGDNIKFDMPSAVKGKATLRFAICGTGSKYLDVALNGKLVGKVDSLVADGVITRHGIQGIWYEREIIFDAKLIQAGTNTLVLTIPAGPVNDGIVYDYIRLELDEASIK